MRLILSECVSEIAETLRISFQFNKNSRLERTLKQVPLVNSAETTHHSTAKPTVVSTSTGLVWYRDTQFTSVGACGRTDNTDLSTSVTEDGS